MTFKAHRFWGLTSVITRLIAHWDVMEQWYAKRKEQAVEKNQQASPFPLEGEKETLEQLLALLEPINRICKASQVSYLMFF